MGKINIGIIKEGKIPEDRRVPLSPEQARLVQESYSHVDLYCQSSAIRCFKDQEYKEQEIEITEDISHCDILLGVKEVPVKDLIAGKTYFFFSHTIKKQAYNRKLLQEILKKNIRLIDYERLTDKNGQRLIAFGRYAGIVGAYNGILAYGRKYNLFNLRRAKDCFDLHELQKEFSKAHLPAVKIVLTGGGRVTKGAKEVLQGMNIIEVSPEDFLHKSFDHAVYTQLHSEHYHFKKDGSAYDQLEFYTHPEGYASAFDKFARITDILIAAAYWNPMAPVLFTNKEMLESAFRIKVIADITCDINGSIPSTKKSSTIEDPVYDYNPQEETVEKPYSNPDFVSVMAIDNLPCELPRDASTEFGKEMIKNILPSLLGEDKDDIIEKATITEDGALTARYEFLRDYVEEVNLS